MLHGRAVRGPRVAASVFKRVVVLQCLAHELRQNTPVGYFERSEKQMPCRPVLPPESTRALPRSSLPHRAAG